MTQVQQEKLDPPGKLEPVINLVIGLKLQLHAEIIPSPRICSKNKGIAFTKK